MPLMRIDVVKGHDEKYLKQLLDIAYEVQLEAFKTPEGDRYQVLNQHEQFEMQVSDTGLGIERSQDVVVFNIIIRPKPTKAKKIFFRRLTERLEQELGLKKSDVMICLLDNHDDDWSFGNGNAEFLDGQL